MDHKPPPNGSYYQMDPQVTGDQLSSHPSHALHNAAYPESNYQPGTGGNTPPPPGPPPGLPSSSRSADMQDSKPYPPPPQPHELSSDSIPDAAYPDSNYRPAAYSPHHESPLELASSSIDPAAYPDSSYRYGTAYSATPSPGPPPGPPPTRPLPCPKHLESIGASQSSWTGEPSSAGPSRVLAPPTTASELPPPPYQPGGTSTPPPHPPQIQPPSPSYSPDNNRYAGYHTSGSSPTRSREEPIPMTTFPVYQNAIGHVANSSNASSALERNYKEYDRDQAVVDETSRRKNRRKWLMGSIATTLVVAGIIGVVVALLRNGVFDDDDDDDD